MGSDGGVPAHERGGWIPWTAGVLILVFGFGAWDLWRTEARQQREAIERLAIENVVVGLRLLVETHLGAVEEIALREQARPVSSQEDWEHLLRLNTVVRPRFRAVAWLDRDGRAVHVVAGEVEGDKACLAFLDAATWRDQFRELAQRGCEKALLVDALRVGGQEGDLVALRDMGGSGVVVAVVAADELLDHGLGTAFPGFDIEVCDGDRILVRKGDWSVARSATMRTVVEADSLRWTVRLRTSASADARQERRIDVVVWACDGIVALLVILALRAARVSRAHARRLEVVRTWQQREIEERRQAEDKLARSEATFRLLAENATDLISRHRLDGTFSYVSPAARRLLGFEPEELSGRHIESLVHPDDTELWTHSVERLLVPPHESRVIYRIQRKDGSYVWFETLGRLLLDRDTGAPHEIQCASRDVSRRVGIERALRESEERFRSSFESAAIGMALVGTDGRWLRVNAALCEMLGSTADDLIGRTVDTITHRDDRDRELLLARELLAGQRRSYQLEKRCLHREGHPVWVLVSVSLLREENGEPLYFIVQIENIQQRKRAEEQLRSSLRDKEILLQEVHHRVKNNLQVVSSLLHLQARHAADPATRQTLNEAVTRVRSMALIHEKIYRSDDLAGVNFADYAESLAAQLFKLLAPPEGRIKLRTDCAPVPVSLSRAVPLALILNELVSNALKHAFPDERPGTISISLRSEGMSGLFSVADDGVGISGDAEQQTRTSLGFTLVQALARQMNAEVSYETGAGTRAVVSFPLDADPPRSSAGDVGGIPKSASHAHQG